MPKPTRKNDTGVTYMLVAFDDTGRVDAAAPFKASPESALKEAISKLVDEAKRREVTRETPW